MIRKTRIFNFKALLWNPRRRKNTSWTNDQPNQVLFPMFSCILNSIMCIEIENIFLWTNRKRCINEKCMCTPLTFLFFCVGNMIFIERERKNATKKDGQDVHQNKHFSQLIQKWDCTQLKTPPNLNERNSHEMLWQRWPKGNLKSNLFSHGPPPEDQMTSYLFPTKQST